MDAKNLNEESELSISKDTEMSDVLEKPKSTDLTSDDSSDSDSDSDSEAQQNLQLQALESDLSINPSNYDANVQYIKILRKTGELEKLRQARENMSELFPLSPSMWQEWAKDEASISTGTAALPEIEKIYERGILDYLSVSLWYDYLTFVQERGPSIQECSPDGIMKKRDLFERAIMAAGLHVTEGTKIWEAYREFEQAILVNIDGTDNEEKEKQVQRIRSIFHRQLSVPLADKGSTLIGYKAWEVEQGNCLGAESADLDGISSQIVSAYRKALEMYNARAHLEDNIAKMDIPDSEKFQQFMFYLKFEQSSGDPARVQALYERAITDFPVSSDLWLDYTLYMDRTLKVGKIVRDVYFRATRNCPWIGELWVRYLLFLERNHASENEISSVFEKSLQCTLSTVEEYLDLFLTRIDGLRRRISSSNQGEAILEYSLIRQTFQQASDYLSPNMINTDALLRLHAYWARLELHVGKDIVAARGVWESFLKNSGSMLEVWQGYISMETELGHINEARSIYKRCYTKRFPGTGSEDICNLWLRFEREYGNLDHYDHAVQKVTPRLKELQLFRLQQEPKSLATTTDQREPTLKKTVREKRKPGSNLAIEESPAKRQKGKGQKLKKVEEQAPVPAEANMVENKKANADKVDSSNDHPKKAKVDKVDISNDHQTKASLPAKQKVYTDKCTAFISNINLQANANDIRQIFNDVGGVDSIRLLHDKFTKKSRGLAYVDFIDDDHLTSALAKNKTVILGKKISIARSKPKSKRAEHGSHSVHAEQGEPIDRAENPESVESGQTLKATSESSVSQTTSGVQKHGGDSFQLKGKNTFAVPRNVRPLGAAARNPKAKEGDGEQLKSNDEFRKMFIKG